MLAERVEGGPRQVSAGQTDSGERGQGEFCEIDVVEADDGQILRHAQTLHVGGAQNADGGHVVRADDGRGPRTESLQLTESDDATLERVIAFDDPLLLDR